MKTQIQSLRSSKLFYNKWPYKIACVQTGASKVIHIGVERCLKFCQGKEKDYFSNNDKKFIDKNDFSKFISATEPFLSKKDSIQIRVEGSHFNLFCKDIKVVEEIESALQKWIVGIWGPTTEEELNFLLANGHKKVLCDEFPKKKFKFKVYLKYKFPPEKRLSFLTWTEKYCNDLKISATTKRWLRGDRFYAQDPFMYVTNDKMLSMLGLYLSGYIKRVDEYILRDKVLTA